MKTTSNLETDKNNEINVMSEDSNIIAEISVSARSLSQRLSDDLDSLKRVRNRLVSTTQTRDEQLPNIITQLVPRLFCRLQKYSTDFKALVIQTQNDRHQLADLSTIQKSKCNVEHEIYATLASGMERLKALPMSSPSSSSTTTQPLAVHVARHIIPAMLPFLCSDHNVVVAWSISYINIGIERYDTVFSPSNTIVLKDYPQQTPDGFDWSVVIESLVRSLAKTHADLSRIGPLTPTAASGSSSDSALISRYCRISWLLLDFIMLLSGYRPIIDWDMNEFTPKIRQHSSRLDCKQTRSSIVTLIQNMETKETNINGGHKIDDDNDNDQSYIASSVISLVLDLILFCPDNDASDQRLSLMLSYIGLQRMMLRVRTNESFVDNDHNDQLRQQPRNLRLRDDLPVQFQRPMQRQHKLTTSFCESAKVYLRYLKLSTIKLMVWPVEDAFFQPAIRLMNREQNISPMAAFDDRTLFLAILTANSESMHGRVAMDLVNKWRSCGTSPIRSQVASERHVVTGPRISLGLVCSVLILCVGEAALCELLEEFKTINGNGCWHRILGPTQHNKSLQRPQLPSAVVQSSTEIIMRNTTIQWTGNQSMDAAYCTLLVTIVVKLIQQSGKHQKYLALRLISWIYLQLESPPRSIAPLILEAVIEILQIVVDVGESDRDEFRTLPTAHLPGGVPTPFNRRHDLNRLLTSHRQALNRKKMASDDALTARKEAYRLIELLAPSVLKWEKQTEKAFVLPRLLLTCSSYEDPRLKHFVLEALDSLLEQYMKCNDTLDNSESAVLLLPALVEAMLSNDEGSRRTAMVWIQRLLVRQDKEASLYLCSNFSSDEDEKVARIANEVLSDDSLQSEDKQMIDRVIVNFFRFDEGNGPGATLIRNDIESRIQRLRGEYLITRDESIILLIEKSFSLKDTVKAHITDRQNLWRVCGLIADPQISNNKKCKQVEDDSYCGICYDQNLCSEGMFSLSCQHKFCELCWSSYIHTASQSDHQSFLHLRCPQQDCHSRVLPSHIVQLARNYVSRWNDAVTETFIESQPHIRYCPGTTCDCVAIADCSDGIILSDLVQQTAEICCNECGESFCLQCGEPPHQPASCDSMKYWKVVMAKSGISKKLSSKPCPGCGSFIEKSGGCSHMKCTMCGTDFCWLCLKLLERHLQQHQCQPYDPSTSADDETERHELFTASRFQAHDDARQFALTQSRSFSGEKLIESFWFLDEKEDDGIAGPVIMESSLSTLITSRLILMHSYIELLGLSSKVSSLSDEDYDNCTDHNKYKEHEAHHLCLEMFTERLAQLTETNLQRLYLEEGQFGVVEHFHKLKFYNVTVIQYMGRIVNKKSKD